MRKPAYSRFYLNCPDADERSQFASSEWDALVGHLELTGTLTDQRKRMVDLLVKDRTEHHFLSAKIVSEGPIKDGPNGGEMFSFEWSACRKLSDAILKREDALRIFPEKGQAETAPDRPKTPADKFLGKIGTRPN